MADVAVDVHLGRRGRAGRLWLHRGGRTESATFRYDPDYLAERDAYALDPALPLVDFAQHTVDGQALFGAFTDTAPDGWGRRLIVRAQQRRAEREDRTPQHPAEATFLLGVRDDLRQGALRFHDRATETFLTPGRRRTSGSRTGGPRSPSSRRRHATGGT